MSTITLNEQPVRLVPRTNLAATTDRWSIDDVAALFDLPFAELIHRSSAAFGGRLEQAREGRRGWPALEAVTLEILRDVDSHPAFVQILQSELFRTGRPWADVIGDARAHFLGPIIEVLREVADERVTAGLTRELPPRSVTDSVAASLLGALAVAALDRRVHAAERTVEDVHAGLLQAISGLRA